MIALSTVMVLGLAPSGASGASGASKKKAPRRPATSTTTSTTVRATPTTVPATTAVGAAPATTAPAPLQPTPIEGPVELADRYVVRASNLAVKTPFIEPAPASTYQWWSADCRTVAPTCSYRWSESPISGRTAFATDAPMLDLSLEGGRIVGRSIAEAQRVGPCGLPASGPVRMQRSVTWTITAVERDPTGKVNRFAGSVLWVTKIIGDRPAECGAEPEKVLTFEVIGQSYEALGCSEHTSVCVAKDVDVLVGVPGEPNCGPGTALITWGDGTRETVDYPTNGRRMSHSYPDRRRYILSISASALDRTCQALPVTRSFAVQVALAPT